MAYSLNDPYRLYRYVLRTNALLGGLGLGLLLLGQPHWAADLLGWPMPRQVLWPVRLGGAGLAGMGLLFLDLAAQPVIRGRSSWVVMACNALLAGVVLTAYLTGDLAPTTPVGIGVLLILFLNQLVCAVLPLTYLGENLKP